MTPDPRHQLAWVAGSHPGPTQDLEDLADVCTITSEMTKEGDDVRAARVGAGDGNRN
jgi:hypothetical protein